MADRPDGSKRAVSRRVPGSPPPGDFGKEAASEARYAPPTSENRTSGTSPAEPSAFRKNAARKRSGETGNLASPDNSVRRAAAGDPEQRGLQGGNASGEAPTPQRFSDASEFGASEFFIRKADLADARHIFETSEASFSGAERWSERLFYDDLQDPAKRYFVAVKRGVPTSVVGFSGAAHILDEAHIMDIAVLPEVRNRGVGTALLAAALSDAAEAGIRSATLEVRAGNLKAKRLYIRAGFALSGVRKHYYPDKEDAEIYWKEW